MKLGEWLLVSHPEHVQQLSLLTVRLNQCQKAYASLSDTIEKLTLQEPSLDEPPQRNTENINEEITRTFQQLMHLEMKIHKLNDYMSIYEIIFSSLPEKDKWLINNHFNKKRSMVELAKESFPDGDTYSKSMLHILKNRIIDHVTELCELMGFCPTGFNDE